MSDKERQGWGGSLGTDAAVEAGKGLLRTAVKDAVEELALSDAERARRDQERDAKAKSLKWKVALGAVGVVLLLVVVVGALASLWKIALSVLLAGGVGGAVFLYLRPKVRALKERAQARLRAAQEEKARDDASRRQLAEAAAKEKKLADELARLKQKAEGPRG